MGKEVSVFGCNNRFNEYGRNILIRGVFTVRLIKKNPDNTVPVVRIDRALRKDDFIDSPSLYMILGGSGYLNIKRKKDNARDQHQNEKGKNNNLKFPHVPEPREKSLFP
jgi:hypothetical protein